MICYFGINQHIVMLMTMYYVLPLPPKGMQRYVYCFTISNWPLLNFKFGASQIMFMIFVSCEFISMQDFSNVPKHHCITFASLLNIIYHPRTLIVEWPSPPFQVLELNFVRASSQVCPRRKSSGGRTPLLQPTWACRDIRIDHLEFHDTLNGVICSFNGP